MLFQLDQLDKIFKVLGEKIICRYFTGHPTPEKWPTLVNLPYWQNDQQHIQGHKYDSHGLHNFVTVPQKSPAYDLLSKMLEYVHLVLVVSIAGSSFTLYDPRKRITAAQALEHE
ncbi:hypothetical protein GW17_00001727 [Ensete ventricosum]|nr:hypothetical protein GW17_00001727 [Ensete ventricosum]